MSDTPEIPKDLHIQKGPHPLIASLPPHLKDPANYEKVQRLVLDALASKHSHSEMMQWATCASCQQRFAERGDILKKLGFKNPAQYALWKRVHNIIRGDIKKDILPKYDD